METEASQLLSKAPPLGVEQVGIALEAVSVTPVRFLQLVIYSAAIFMSVLNYSVMVPIYNYGLDRFDVSLQALNSLANIRTAATIPGAHGFRAHVRF
jgi:hypothetical protein